MKLRLRLLLLIALAVSGALAASFWLIASAVRQQALRDVDRSLVVAHTVWRTLSASRAQSMVAAARGLAAEPGFVTVLRGTDRATLLDYLQVALENNTSIDVVAVTDARGLMAVSTSALRVAKSDPLIEAALAGQAAASYWSAGGALYLAAAAPVYRQGDVIEGVLLLGQHLDREFVQGLSRDTSTDVSLLQGLAAPLSTLQEPGALLPAASAVQWPEDGSAVPLRLGTNRTLLAPLADYKGTPIASLAMTRDARETLAYLGGVTRQLLLLGAVTLALASAASIPLIGRVTNPVLQLEKTRAEMDAVFEANLDGLVALDQTGRIVTANPAAAVCLGKDAEDLRGEALQALLPERVFAQLLGTQPAAGQVVQRTEYSREDRVFELVRTFVASRHAEVGSVLVTRDLTEQEQNKHSFVRFLDTLAPTLRAGLQANSPGARLRFEKDLQNLLVLAGAPPLGDQPPIDDFGAALEEQFAALAPLAAGASLQIDGPLPSVDLQAAHLRVILLNLLDNAARHGRPPILVRAFSPGGGCWLWVSDAGRGGLPPVHASFPKVDSSRLGLAVVATLVETCGGRVEVEGSLVQLWLPARG